MKQVLAALLAIALMPSAALAWGSDGHRMINRVAAERFPASLPAFVRSPQALALIVHLGPEEDRLKGAGASWDKDDDPGHFLDLGDDGTVAGVVTMTALPPSMEAYAKALTLAHTDPYKMGFVPYTIIDGWEQLRKDFAIWRVDAYMAAHATTAAARARFAQDRVWREQLTLDELGTWGHFVADGSQPLHITVHYNGWGDYPNPHGYGTSHHIHSMFESEFVAAHVTLADVRAHVSPYKASNPRTLLTQSEIAAIVGAYLSGSERAVPALYEIEKAGGFAHATPQAVDFTAAQLARGASMLRDFVALAWEDSLNASVGYPEVPVRDILSGKVVPRD